MLRPKAQTRDKRATQKCTIIIIISLKWAVCARSTNTILVWCMHLPQFQLTAGGVCLPLSCALASFFLTRAVSQSAIIRFSCGARAYMWLKCIIKVLCVANSIEKWACSREQRTMCGGVFDALISAVWLVASLIEFCSLCWSTAMQIHRAVGDTRAL